MEKTAMIWTRCFVKLGGKPAKFCRAVRPRRVRGSRRSIHRLLAGFHETLKPRVAVGPGAGAAGFEHQRVTSAVSEGRDMERIAIIWMKP